MVTTELQRNIEEVRERIGKAVQKTGRRPEEVTLVLVTKTIAPNVIQEAFEAGFRDFGENRVQELLSKKPVLPKECRWHLIGHLQTNKVKSILGEVVSIQSLDRLALAEEVQKQAEKKNLQVGALVQVNTSGEATKSGFTPEEVESALEKIKSFDRIQVRGFMTIGPFTKEEQPIRECFQKLRSLRERLKARFSDMDLKDLSMGMSSDFEMAIEEGATIVRIGTAVFGERKK